ncbi:uncharacterized protein LOC113239672 [Hyposmocoma kahamanoa]|uniref:uncharacterized protein LOC113239672 n=1 Tax=Hyposmocoma kahamanoa TaxID=1477025 RepID=UPI000E6D8EC9|nr:uncharacterized protein LOC113239672 [Hyposmocoma kahamanoa]
MLVSTLLTVLYGFASTLPKQPESKMLFYGAMAATATCHSGTGCFLIYGAFWKKPRWMWPWIVLSWSWSVLMLIAAIAGFALLHYNDVNVDDDVNYVISAYILFSAVMYYLASIVNSRRRELMQGQMFSAVKTWNRPATAWSYTRAYSTWRYV